MMTRDDFFARLRRGLEKLSPEEIENVLRYYTEYFDEAGPENEEQILRELGDPMVIAQQIVAESMVRDIVAEPQPVRQETSQEPRPPKRGLSAVWTVVLAIFAAPIALPVAIAIAAVAFSLVLVAAVVILAFVIAAVGLIVSGVAAFLLGCVALFTNFLTGVFAVGAGFAVGGLGILLLLPVLHLGRSLFTAIARFIGRKVFVRNGEGQ